MAITGKPILKTVNKVGNFLIREQWRDRNFCRAEGPIIMTRNEALVPEEFRNDVLEVGQIVFLDNDGFWKCVNGNSTASAQAYGILVDERAGDPSIYTMNGGQLQPDWSATSTDVVHLAVLVSGDAIVRKDGLIGTDDQAHYDALEAQGIKVQDTLKGAYGKPQAFKTL